MTWSPILTLCTSGPSSTTTPAASWPSTMGSGSGQSPFMMCQSLMQTPAAFTCTRTSPALGPSCSRSRSSSGLLTAVSTAARMMGFPPGGLWFGELDELGRHGVRQPHAVVRQIELVAGGPHTARGDAQDGGPAMAPADSRGGGGVCRQMHVLAAAGLQTFGADRRDGGVGRAVKQHRRRLPRLQPQVDIDGVALVRPQALPRGVEREALLVAGGNDVEYLLPRQRHAMLAGPSHERVDVCPAPVVEREADAPRLVAQHEAQELAHLPMSGGSVWRHGGGPLAA